MSYCVCACIGAPEPQEEDSAPKSKRTDVQCYKCKGWGHFASNCYRAAGES